MGMQITKRHPRFLILGKLLQKHNNLAQKGNKGYLFSVS